VSARNVRICQQRW